VELIDTAGASDIQEGLQFAGRPPTRVLDAQGRDVLRIADVDRHDRAVIAARYRQGETAL